MDKKLTRTHISARDFDKAQAFAEAAAKHDVASIEHEALLLSAIVCYGRPFSGNEKGKKAKADSELTGVDIPAVLGAADYALHSRILLLRHKAVAHSHSEKYPVGMIAPQVGEPGSRSAGFVSRSWHPVNEQIDLEAFARIAKAMAWACRCNLLDGTRGALAESLVPVSETSKAGSFSR